MARVNDVGACRTQVEITMINESIHPPRFNEHLEVRYYLDVTELVAAGVDPSTITVEMPYDNTGDIQPERTVVVKPVACEKNSDVWYFKLSYEGQKFWGSNPWTDGPRVSLVDFGVGNSGDCTWNAANDWSFQGLTETVQKTPYITAYGEDGKLLWGEEPECHEIRSVIHVE